MATNDGSANAPASALQGPTLWHVKNPTAISMAGMSVKSMKLAEFSAWTRIGIDVTMPSVPLAAAKKVGAVPDWRLAASGLFTVNDADDNAITDQKFGDLRRDPNGGHFRVNSVEQVPGTAIDLLASKMGEVSCTVSDAQQAQSLDEGGGRAGDTATSAVGTATTITVADGAPSVTAATPIDTASMAEPVSNVSTAIPADATLELAYPYAGTVAFAGATGTLKIDNSSSFSGTIAGQLAIGNVIDLADITAGANATITYSGTQLTRHADGERWNAHGPYCSPGQLFASELYSI